MVNNNWPDGLRPFRWDDLEPLADLLSVSAEFDDSGEFRTADSLRTMLSLPGRNAEETVFVLPDTNGNGLIAECGAWFLKGVESDTVSITVHVHPDYRTQELYDQLLRIAQSCGRRICPSDNWLAEFHVGVYKTQSQLNQSVKAAGYEPVRWFIDMLRDLKDPISTTAVPNGMSIVAFERTRDAKALKLALDESFLDHWNSLDFSDEQFDHWISSAAFRPDLTLVAYAADGESAAGCIGMVREGYNQRTGSTEGHINTLGVRRPYRQLGLAKAMLAESFRRMIEAGMNAVSLEVDADNPTGATTLYTSMGFEERRRSVIYSRPVAAIEADD